jgi:hypothetical protein
MLTIVSSIETPDSAVNGSAILPVAEGTGRCAAIEKMIDVIGR